MANDATGNPIIIDTASSTVPIITSPVRVQSFLFKPAAASDQVILKDMRGNVILDLMANASTAEKQIVFEPHDSRFYGIQCTTLTSNAKLYVYLNPVCS